MHKVGAVRNCASRTIIRDCPASPSDVGTEGLRGGSEMVGVIMPLGRRMPLGDGEGVD